MMRNWGLDIQDSQITEGHNYRMDAIQGAILRVKLKYLDKWNESRRSIARVYNKILADTPVKTPVESDENGHVYHIYSIQCSNRDSLRQRLGNLGISTKIHYPVPIHMQPVYQYLGYKRGDFPISEILAKGVLSFPIYPEIPEADINYIAENILNY